MIGIVVERASELASGEAVLAELAEAHVDALASHPDVAAYAVSGREIRIHLVLGGDSQAEAWDVRPDALGFFAVSSDERDDGDGTWFEIPERFEIHVNLRAGVEVLRETWLDREPWERVVEVECWLETVPHEILHALEWIRETGGRTPDEVFVEGRGELSIRDTLRAIESRLAGNGKSGEDVVEEAGRSLLSKVLDGAAVDAAVATLDAELSPAPSP